jgi:hypothetical protein
MFQTDCTSSYSLGIFTRLLECVTQETHLSEFVQALQSGHRIGGVSTRQRVLEAVLEVSSFVVVEQN